MAVGGAAALKGCSAARAANRLMPVIASHASTVPAAICRINFTGLQEFELLRVSQFALLQFTPAQLSVVGR